jgi:nucleotide-binding universal stress UspA family protein
VTATVYVPLDGSERAESALAPAVSLASRAGAELVLFSALWPDASVGTVRNYLSARVAFLEHPARPWLILDREPADAILTVSAEPHALVCMSTRGRGAIREALLGSIGEEVVRASVAPVLLVGPEMRADWELGEAPLVLAGLDGSRPSLAAAQAAGDLATSVKARVRAIEVLRPSDVVTVGEFPGGDIEMLKQVVADLAQRGLEADYKLVDGFDAADTLTKLAAAEHAAVIAVASHGRTGFARVALGSIAMRTIRQAPCPVLVSGPAVHHHGGNEAA